MSKIISIDAETNGLWGNPFSIAAIVYESGEEKDRFVARCEIKGDVHPWVESNVLPEMADIKVTHTSYEKMLEDFSSFWLKHKNDSNALWHMGHVVEAYLFRECHRLGYIGDFDAPYTPIELSEILRAKGFAPDSVDDYMSEKRLSFPDVVGGTHNPLYDAVVAAKVYYDLL